MATDANTTAGPRLGRLALAGAAALLAAATSAGCHNNHDNAGATSHGERFPRDTDVRPVDRFAQVQSAAGARSDATLNGSHFDGRGGLNSLGRQKLDLMLRDDDRYR